MKKVLETFVNKLKLIKYQIVFRDNSYQVQRVWYGFNNIVQ